MSKPYDPGLAHYDDSGISAVVKFLNEHGYDVKVKPDGQYGIDLICYNGHTVGIEVEVKAGWKSNDWPSGWTTIHITSRKLKQFKGVGPVFDRIEFWILNQMLTTAVVLDGSGFLKSPETDIECKSAAYTGTDSVRDIPFILYEKICHLDTGEIDYNGGTSV